MIRDLRRAALVHLALTAAAAVPLLAYGALPRLLPVTHPGRPYVKMSLYVLVALMVFTAVTARRQAVEHVRRHGAGWWPQASNALVRAWIVAVAGSSLGLLGSALYGGPEIAISAAVVAVAALAIASPGRIGPRR